MIAAILVLGSVVGFNVYREDSLKVPVQTQKVGKRDLISLVTASGEVKPKRFVNIGANVSGRIVQLLVKEGDLVKKDQVLARIESERYEAGTRMSEAAVQSALADLDRAQADLDISRLQLDRTKKMIADRLVSAQTYDQADAEVKMKAANVEAARRRVAQLQAQHDSNRDDLRKTTVFSPMSGVVTSLPKEEGEVVIGAQSFSPTVMMTVADLSVMECEIMVDETDIRNLALGQPAQIRVDALEGVQIQGEVTEIGSSAIVRGSTPGTPATTQTGANTGNQAKDFKVTITLKSLAWFPVLAPVWVVEAPQRAGRPHPGGGGAPGGRRGQARRPRGHPQPDHGRRQHGGQGRQGQTGRTGRGIRGLQQQGGLPAREDGDPGRDGGGDPGRPQGG